MKKNHALDLITKLERVWPAFVMQRVFTSGTISDLDLGELACNFAERALRRIPINLQENRDDMVNALCVTRRYLRGEAEYQQIAKARSRMRMLCSGWSQIDEPQRSDRINSALVGSVAEASGYAKAWWKASYAASHAVSALVEAGFDKAEEVAWQLEEVKRHIAV